MSKTVFVSIKMEITAKKKIGEGRIKVDFSPWKSIALNVCRWWQATNRRRKTEGSSSDRLGASSRASSWKLRILCVATRRCAIDTPILCRVLMGLMKDNNSAQRGRFKGDSRYRADSEKSAAKPMLGSAGYPVEGMYVYHRSFSVLREVYVLIMSDSVD